MSLRRRLAEFGFESNEDHEFALRCAFANAQAGLRVLDLCGDSGRRKTAFAHALGQALNYPRVLYHDFSLVEPAEAAEPVDLAPDPDGHREPPLSHFDRAMTEACAYSEAEDTLIILDQLQVAPFSEQVRLYHLTQTREWTTRVGTVLANPRRLVLALISEQPLYHSLQKASFRIWTGSSSNLLEFKPEEFGLDASAMPVMNALFALFRGLQAAPTQSEVGLILDDAAQRVRTLEQLRQSLFGRIENLDRGALLAEPVVELMEEAVAAISDWVGYDHIEL